LNSLNADSEWDTAELQGKLVWDESEEAELKECQVRYSPGTDEDTILAHISPTEPREYLTLEGLTNPGNTALFKIYVILDTGNEKGSNTVSITREV
jgi:hypothetical protein